MVEGTNGQRPWAPSSQWGCLVVCYDYSEGYRCHQQDELQSEYFDVNVSLHSTILYHQAVESIDGTTSTENDPHIVREHLFVISLGWYPGLPLSAQSSGIDSRISSTSVADENKTLWERIFGRGRTTGIAWEIYNWADLWENKNVPKKINFFLRCWLFEPCFILLLQLLGTIWGKTTQAPDPRNSHGPSTVSSAKWTSLRHPNRSHLYWRCEGACDHPSWRRISEKLQNQCVCGGLHHSPCSIKPLWSPGDLAGTCAVLW